MHLLLSLMLNLSPATAMDYPGCTQWEKAAGVSCIFAGKDSNVWRRDCSEAHPLDRCMRRPGNMPPKTPCLSERMCTNMDPNLLESDCTPWVREKGTKCSLEGNRTKIWRRSCQWDILSTTACTTFRKEYPSEEDFIY